jgi:trk system potassium uptake protein TrkH
MVFLFYIGGMSGSTTGGVKIARFFILFRTMAHKIESIFRPSSVRCLKIGKKEISEGTMQTVLIYFCILIFSVVIGAFLLIVDGLDAKCALRTISSLINNSGMELSPNQTCAFLPPLSKVVGIIWMALGRLEFFALLVFLVPAFWRSK